MTNNSQKWHHIVGTNNRDRSTQKIDCYIHVIIIIIIIIIIIFIFFFVGVGGSWGEGEEGVCVGGGVWGRRN